jgi:hypothetical protein
MSEPMDEMQKHLAEAQAEIARLKDEITELTKHVQLGAEHRKDPIWAMLKSEMANQGYRKGYDKAMEKSHQSEDQLQKRSAELEQLLSECIRHQYVDEARASHFWLIAAKKAVGFLDADERPKNYEPTRTR